MLVLFRKQANLSQRQAAAFFDMTRYGSLADWESGKSKPRVTRRPQFIVYLIDKLGLRNNYQQFLEIWNDVMVEEWAWDPLTDTELHNIFPGHSVTATHFAPENLAKDEHVTNDAGELAQLVSLVIGQTTPATNVLWAIMPGDAPPKHLPNGMTFHSVSLTRKTYCGARKYIASPST